MSDDEVDKDPAVKQVMSPKDVDAQSSRDNTESKHAEFLRDTSPQKTPQKQNVDANDGVEIPQYIGKMFTQLTDKMDFLSKAFDEEKAARLAAESENAKWRSLEEARARADERADREVAFRMKAEADAREEAKRRTAAGATPAEASERGGAAQTLQRDMAHMLPVNLNRPIADIKQAQGQIKQG